MAEKIELRTPNNSLVLELNKGAEPLFVYYGPALKSQDIAQLPSLSGGRAELYPAYGATHTTTETCLAMRHADGNMSTQMLISDYKISSIKDKAPNGADRSGELLTITLTDPLYPTTVRLYYQSYDDVDMIEYWSDITNGEKKTVTLTQFYNPLLPVRRGNVWCSHFHGTWAAEAQLYDEPLTNGTIVLKEKDGIRNAFISRNEVMLSLDGKAQENEGAVIGASLLYSGPYRVTIDTDDTDYHYYFAGIHPDNSEYHLKKGETFTTPHSAITYSTKGTNGVSQAFHRWARRYQLRHGNQERMILLNSWEGVYLDIKAPEMDQMMKDIASMGGELFVMDDGWFGDKYPRDTDKSSLGDWVVNKKKLPEGIEGLVASAKKHGVKFGIWIEPEMSNTKSELFENHPEWILQHKNRPLTQGRGGTQVVLDLTNPKVQDYVFSITDNLLTKHPEIAYIKWDNNAEIMNYNSLYLPANRQQELNVRYQMGIQKVLKRIRDKYKDVVIQLCAGGGGRVSYGFLPYFDEFWTSDNTDAIQRLFIQWGDTHFFPAKAMASHVSASPNHQTHRTLPLKFRFDVAMTGRLGMELQPKDMKPEEKEFSKRSIAAYKEIRPIVQEGDLYRLVSPYERKPITALMYANADKSKIVVFAYRMEYLHSQKIEPLLLTGVDENKKYLIKDLTPWEADKPNNLNGKTVSGKILKYMGLGLGQTLNRPESSMAIELIAQ